MAVSITSPLGLTSYDRSLPVFFHSHKPHSHSNYIATHDRTFSSTLNLNFHYHSPLRASRRTISNPDFPQDGIGDIAEGTRKWARSIDLIYNDDDDAENFDDDDDDDADEEEEDRSLDLLIRFLQNVFRKISKRAKRAVRSVLPRSISPKLVGFSVNGVLVLTFLWVLKAFLEVVCTLGSVVFVSILVVRGIWTGLMYLQNGRLSKLNGYDPGSTIWTGTRPAA